MDRLAAYGRSKEKRSDCPLVTLGLVLDGSGFVRRSKIFEGNASEGKTLEHTLKHLGASAGALVFMDAGIATEANLTWLREHGYRYIVVSRERVRHFDANTATPIETAAGGTVCLQRVDDPNHQEVRLYCHSELREQKERSINQRLCERFEAGLQKIADGLNTPRSEKRLDKLQQRIGRLKEKYRGIGQHYTIELLPDEAENYAIGHNGSQQVQTGSRLSHSGVYCLRSNETQWDSEQLWHTYIMLTDLEAVFRSLKSELGLRPVYHHTKIRVDGHLFITAGLSVRTTAAQITARTQNSRPLVDIARHPERTTACDCLIPTCRRRYLACPQNHPAGNGTGGNLPSTQSRPLAWRFTKNHDMT